MDFTEIEIALKTEYPEATEAEVKRYVRSCHQAAGKKSTVEQVKAEAEKALEEYLDWRSCYGLDYKKEEATAESNTSEAVAAKDTDVGEDDARDWRFAVEKALSAWGSLKRAKELEQKLAQEKNKADETPKPLVNYDMDVSDSHKSDQEDDKEENEQSTESKDPSETTATTTTTTTTTDEGTKTEESLADEEKKKELSQVIFQHLVNNENVVTDREGNKILYVLPALINRQVADADFYSLALSFYLDRKFDRSSEEKMTVLIDVRAGQGWPNPLAVMMIKFAHTVAKQLQHRYPERLKALVVFPLPFVAIGVWSAIKSVFHLEIMNKVILASGPADQESPIPMDKLEGVIDPEILDSLEKLRRDHFKPS